ASLSRVHVGDIIWNQGSAPHISPLCSPFSLGLPETSLPSWLMCCCLEHAEDINMVTCGEDPQAADRWCLVTVEGEGMKSYLLGSEVKNHASVNAPPPEEELYCVKPGRLMSPPNKHDIRCVSILSHHFAPPLVLLETLSSRVSLLSPLLSPSSLPPLPPPLPLLTPSSPPSSPPPHSPSSPLLTPLLSPLLSPLLTPLLSPLLSPSSPPPLLSPSSALSICERPFVVDSSALSCPNPSHCN
ncbi:hypothetical protein KUCAC02_002799, partial [Chaenocephalus aceratus]